jgi:hypothetical protein
MIFVLLFILICCISIYLYIVKPSSNKEALLELKGDINRSRYYFRTKPQVTSVITNVRIINNEDAIITLSVKFPSGTHTTLETHYYLFKQLWKRF